jgi:hypothetical protein
VYSRKPAPRFKLFGVRVPALLDLLQRVHRAVTYRNQEVRAGEDRHLVKDDVVVSERRPLNDEKPVGIVALDLWPLVSMHGVFHSERVEIELGLQQLEVVRLWIHDIQPDKRAFLFQNLAYL